MSMQCGRQRRRQVRHQRHAARRRHAGAAHHHDDRRAAAAAGRRRHAADRRSTAPRSRRRRTRRSWRSPPTSRLWLNARPGAPRTSCATRVEDVLETKKEKIVIIKADEDARVRRRDGRDGRAARQRHRGHGPHHRARSPARLPRREASNGGPPAPRRRHGLQGRGPAGQRGHEHHADDRRAARAPRHLHGRPAALAARARHQPAGGNAARRTSSSPTQPDRARVHRRQEDLDQQAGRDRPGARGAAAHHLRGAQGQDDVHRGAGNLRYGDIVDVIDAAKGAGVEKVGIVTEGMRRAAAAGAAPGTD